MVIELVGWYPLNVLPVWQANRVACTARECVHIQWLRLLGLPAGPLDEPVPHLGNAPRLRHVPAGKQVVVSHRLHPPCIPPLYTPCLERVFLI